MRGGRQRKAVLGASLVGGSGELLDFLVPLWAGAALGATPTQIGLLVGVELAVSFVARALAGRASDTYERTRVAALGAALYAASCAVYAVAPNVGVAFVAAVVGGVGGPLLWVSVRAVVAEALEDDAEAFARLTSAVAFASWFFWFPAMYLLPLLDFFGVFTALAVTCAIGAIGLLLAPRVATADRTAPRPLRRDVLRLRPLLGAVMLMAVAEGGIGLLLLLHLQASFGLEIYQIALVYLPGGIAMTVLPRPLHRLSRRWGRRATYAGACLASAICFAGLAVAPGPVAVAVLWVLASAGWAALAPLQEAVVAEACEDRVGRGMSLLGNAALVGATVGVMAGGALYEAFSWAWACLALGLVAGGTAVLGPRALRAMGVPDQPSGVVDATPGRSADGT
ncbi:MFS transporter [Actinotalea sp. C106]|uniref:MFS transporter n=1 Tax=Actinotalea sp. C106 TaxID=2908644 RepID=UPI0020293054|nr:MFS transporter [Actinotalea sp. C106]